MSLVSLLDGDLVLTPQRLDEAGTERSLCGGFLLAMAAGFAFGVLLALLQLLRYSATLKYRFIFQNHVILLSLLLACCGARSLSFVLFSRLNRS